RRLPAELPQGRGRGRVEATAGVVQEERRRLTDGAVFAAHRRLAQGRGARISPYSRHGTQPTLTRLPLRVQLPGNTALGKAFSRLATTQARCKLPRRVGRMARRSP